MKAVLVLGLAVLAVPLALASQKPPAQQIREATRPLPRDQRDDATVLGYRSGDTLEVLREGSNHFICLADPPGDDRFQVSCYHRSLEPFMARGRELAAQGVGRGERNRIRNEEVAAGRLAMPMAAMISMFGDLREGQDRPDSVNILRVLYLPYATAEGTGLPLAGRGGGPWLMDEGTPRAHVMIPQGRRAFDDRGRRRRRRRDRNAAVDTVTASTSGRPVR